MRQVLISLKEENLNKIDYKKKYQRTWLQLRRNEWLKKNGPCKVCGTWENLEIDHIDPSKNKIRIATIWSRRKEVREKELAKCQVLCKAHHQDKSSEESRVRNKKNSKKKAKAKVKAAS